jgi:hypothetical protein
MAGITTLTGLGAWVGTGRGDELCPVGGLGRGNAECVGTGRVGMGAARNGIR